MWKLALILTVILAVNHSIQKIECRKHKLLKQITINYSKGDECFDFYGYYKGEYWLYNYRYKDSLMFCYATDSLHQVMVFINEYGDTVSKIYIDTSNYPRREED